MRDMKRVSLSKRSRTNMLHVETDGCIVNITRGLADREGRPVTAIEIICAEASVDGAAWRLPDFDNRAGLNVRVMRAPPKPQDDHAVLLSIRDMLDGTTWEPDTLEEIAALLRSAGYRIRDKNERD